MATVAHALTTLTRVKAKLGITNTSFDSVLESLIDAATDYIEGECNRRFLETTHANEVHALDSDGGKFVMLDHAPVSALTSAQYRAGNPATPSWTDFQAQDFELVGDGSSGLVRIYGGVPKGTNNVRFSYTAGYKIDFAGTHTLPFDLSNLCERLVIKMFKKREAVGKKTESAGEASVTWMNELEIEDQAVLDRYRRLFIP